MTTFIHPPEHGIMIAQQLYLDLESTFALGHGRGSVATEQWNCAWRLGPRRIAGKVPDRVLTIQAIELAEDLRGKGVLKELVELIVAKDTIGGRHFTHLAFEDCPDTLLRTLHDKASFTVDDWHFTRVAWRLAGQTRLEF